MEKPVAVAENGRINWYADADRADGELYRVPRGEPSAWMNAQGWTISARGKKDMGETAEVDGYTIPLYR